MKKPQPSTYREFRLEFRCIVAGKKEFLYVPPSDFFRHFLGLFRKGNLGKYTLDSVVESDNVVEDQTGIGTSSYYQKNSDIEE